jgi:Holliday junction resolvase-like predicted endonuclease
VDCFHFRDRDDFEVDIVMERGQAAVAAVEVKAAATGCAVMIRQC